MKFEYVSYTHMIYLWKISTSSNMYFHDPLSVKFRQLFWKQRFKQNTEKIKKQMQNGMQSAISTSEMCVEHKRWCKCLYWMRFSFEFHTWCCSNFLSSYAFYVANFLPVLTFILSLFRLKLRFPESMVCNYFFFKLQIVSHRRKQQPSKFLKSANSLITF